MIELKCKMCGGTLEVEKGQEICQCEYCGTKQTLPKLNNKKRINLYDRANHYRRNNDFDKASDLYEKILNEDSTDSEAYWSLVLCKYGIEYVEDPVSKNRIPTVNRTQITSVFSDYNYQQAIEYASPEQRAIYEEEAKTIDDIQKRILDISRREEPFDIFICYKETDNKGKRTVDSVLANDIYYELVREGYKVFFSRITLEDKLGEAYEPYIFAALNSAKVMIVLGTKAEYFNAVWVKNEWSRFLKMISNGEKKTLIPAYKDMDPYDLPDDFSHLQALDMSKIGFIQDLIRGINKITGKDLVNEQKDDSRKILHSSSSSPLLKRGYMFLEDGDFSSADSYFDKILDSEPENADAYLGKLMASKSIKTVSDFIHYYEDLFNNDTEEKTDACIEDSDHINEVVKKYSITNYLDEKVIRDLYQVNRSVYLLTKSREKQKEQIIEELNNDKLLNRVRQFANANIKSIFDEILNHYDIRVNEARNNDERIIAEAADNYHSRISEIDEKVNELYNEAIAKRDEEYDSLTQTLSLTNSLSELEGIKNKLESFGDYKEANDYLTKANQKIKEEEQIIKENNEKKRKKTFVLVGVIAAALLVLAIIYSTVILPNSEYNNAAQLLVNNKYDEAISLYSELGDYKDSKDLLIDAKYKKASYLLTNKKYEEAIELFSELGDYSDVKDKIQETKYLFAQELFENNDIDRTVELLNEIGDYKDSSGIMAAIEEKYVYLDDFSGKTVSECVTYLKEKGISYYFTKRESKEDEKVLSTTPDSGYIEKGTLVCVERSLGNVALDSYNGDGNTKVLFKVRVEQAGRGLRVRTNPVIKTDLSNKVADLAAGKIVDVFEILYTSEYTWYRVGNKRWIATKDNWVSEVKSQVK